MGAGLPKDVLASCREPQTIGQGVSKEKAWAQSSVFQDADEYSSYDGDLCRGANLLPWENTGDLEQIQGNYCGVFAAPVPPAGSRYEPGDGRERMEVVSSLCRQQPHGIAGFPNSPENNPRGMSSMINQLASPSISRSCGAGHNDEGGVEVLDEPVKVTTPGMHIAADTADGNVLFMSNDGRTMWLENPPDEKHGQDGGEPAVGSAHAGGLEWALAARLCLSGL